MVEERVDFIDILETVGIDLHELVNVRGEEEGKVERENNS